MTAVTAGVRGVESRTALVSIGLHATMAATGFATAALVVRLSGITLVIALAGCGALMALLELSRRRAKQKVGWLPASTHPLVALLFCAAVGAGVAALGTEGGLFFLPSLFVLATISILATARYLVICSTLIALGFFAPAAASGDVGWSAPAAAAALLLLPLGLHRVFRGLADGSKATPADLANPTMRLAPVPGMLTPRQVEVTELLAEGYRHQEVADRLGVSVHQVRRLIRQARERAGARTTAELVAMNLAPAPAEQAEFTLNTPK